MKHILIGDTHFDSKNSNQEYLDNQMKVWHEQIIPLCLEEKIDHIIQLGDITDNRTKIGLNVQHGLFKLFSELEKNNINITILLGNHDIFYKNSREIYSMKVFEKAFNNLMIIEEQTLIDGMLFVPWLVENESIKITSDVKVIFGHFEMKDFYVTKTYQSVHGLDKKIFKNIPVYSGHYHIQQKDKNIHYIGTPCQEDWGDFNEKKGFYIYDSDSNELEFIENTSSSKHLKCHIAIENKTCKVEGFDNITEFKINNKTDYSIFTRHKLKIFARKELAVVKQFIEGIKDIAFNYKLEIHDDEIEDIDIDEKIEKAKKYDITKQIVEINNDSDKEIVVSLIQEAKNLMKE